jgi:hypothetical protein
MDYFFLNRLCPLTLIKSARFTFEAAVSFQPANTENASQTLFGLRDLEDYTPAN